MCLIKANKKVAKDNLVCYKIMIASIKNSKDNIERSGDDFTNCTFHTPFQYKEVTHDIIEGKRLFLPGEQRAYGLYYDSDEDKFTINAGYIHSYKNLDIAIKESADLVIYTSYRGEYPEKYVCIFECCIDKGTDYMEGKVAIHNKDFFENSNKLPDGYASKQLRFVKMVKTVQYHV